MFDIIIIGAGTAGCVLAKRLSKKYEVLLIESGADNSSDSNIKIPSKSFILPAIGFNKYFWSIGNATSDIESEEYSPLPPDITKTLILAGQTLGGSSSISQMLYVRSTAKYYDDIANYLADKDWNAANADRVFKKIEKFNGVAGQYNQQAHGYTGDVDIRQCVLNLDAAKLFTEASAEVLNLSQIDYNDFKTPNGVFNYWQLSQKQNTNRESSYTAYLRNELNKVSDNIYKSKNDKLTLYTSCFAIKLIYDKCKVIGVKVLMNGEYKEILCKDRVIVSMGFQSPLFLQKNGIGRKKELANLDIPLKISNDNVGYNIDNHPGLTLLGVVIDDNPLTPLPEKIDKQALFSGGVTIPAPGSDERLFEWIGISQQESFLIYCLLLNQDSKGKTKIIYPDPLREPETVTNYFEEGNDMINLVYIYQQMYKTLVKMGLKPVAPDGLIAPIPDDISAIEQYINNYYLHAFHWSGGCRMAPNIKEGVVDNNGKVFGLDNLYVADNSILPFSPRGNTQAPALLVGHIIADKMLHVNYL